jgi:gamma-glutamyltranspeptidase/glutathione hydrolase
MVISRNGIVASEHPLASQAAAMILAEGGHAVDAAIAANAVMGVVAPMWNGIGGDLFAIIYDAQTDALFGLNANGWSSAGLTLARLKSTGDEHPTGIHAVTVPGAVAGWAALHERFGRKPMLRLLAPAITYAANGFPVAELNSQIWALFENQLRDHDNASQLYLPNGRVPTAGQIFKNPDLAWSLRQIANRGADAFYRGVITERILAYSERHAGTLAAADFDEYLPEWVTPLSTEYHGWTVYEMPAPTQGVAALSMLNILEQIPLRKYGHNSVASLHAMIEAKKLAYADMAKHVADANFADVPAAAMLSKAYARTRAELIDSNRANCEVPSGSLPAHGGDTTYLSVVDREGNMVSLIQSVYYPFGSGMVADGTGFVLQNRGELFNLDSDHPNVFAPRKRPLHTIIPAFMEHDDIKIAFGIMGGWNQAQAHAQLVSNIVDHDMDIQAALEAARFSKWTFAGCDIMVEARIPESVRADLIQLGHEITVRGDFSGNMGGGQVVLRDFAAEVNYGASDPRKDGSAIPEPSVTH